MPNTGALRISTPTDREIVFTRVFDAPRELVFDAMTRPELLKRWLLGPPGWTMPICEIDLRVGGAYRYVWRSADGVEMGMGGIHREIVRPERIVAHNYSMKIGPAARQLEPSSWLSTMARRHSRTRCSTRRARLATPFSRLPWRMAWLPVTTDLRSCWRRMKLETTPKIQPVRLVEGGRQRSSLPR